MQRITTTRKSGDITSTRLCPKRGQLHDLKVILIKRLLVLKTRLRHQLVPRRGRTAGTASRMTEIPTQYPTLSLGFGVDPNQDND